MGTPVFRTDKNELKIDNEIVPNIVLSYKALTSHITFEPHQQLLKTQVLNQS